MYSIFFTNQARRVFKKLPQDVRDRLKKEASTLGENPLAGEPLQGSYRLYRSLHLNHNGVAYRVIYQFLSKVHSIVIVLADKRENIYKRLEEMKL
jgi:mRNA-degrading endonuclease RelE of RelBE toxin-antitoxin system